MIKYLLLLFLFFSSPANIFSFKALEAETKESFFESGKDNFTNKKYSDALDIQIDNIKLGKEISKEM